MFLKIVWGMLGESLGCSGILGRGILGGFLKDSFVFLLRQI